MGSLGATKASNWIWWVPRLDAFVATRWILKIKTVSSITLPTDILRNNSDSMHRKYLFCYTLNVWGNYIFPPWTTGHCQYTPMNWHIDQNRASNCQLYIFCPLPSFRPVMLDGQRVTCRFSFFFFPLLPSSLL
jgi:hypothetical protein